VECFPPAVTSEGDLVAVCRALLGAKAAGPRRVAAAFEEAIAAGGDPLGDALCALRSPAERRPLGATYTPRPIVEAMMAWAAGRTAPVRVVDPGCGSGRFLLAAGRAFPGAELVGVEIDPVAATLARANLAAAGLAGRARVIEVDYRALALDPAGGPTLFAGNPPYVRHHAIAPGWKEWLTRRAAARGLAASQLAGLHVHFLLATAELARPGDAGIFITASEWLDVNYGVLARALLAGPLGLVRLDLCDPALRAFPDAQATAAIAAFEVGAGPGDARLRRVGSLAKLAPLAGGRAIARARLAAEPRWSQLAEAPGRRRLAARGTIELGELCRVHRGQVTGANRIWIAGADTPALPPAVLVPTVTRARELIAAGRELGADALLRRVIDLPADLDQLPADQRGMVARFLAWARRAGGEQPYVARHRSPWWAVRLLPPAPILVTYMARRPPVFVLNRVAAHHLNIAHGIYPREPMSAARLEALAAALRAAAGGAVGRVYAGGLVKLEPREIERLRIALSG
jgi:adenine-specific DNA-methyltransferase